MPMMNRLMFASFAVVCAAAAGAAPRSSAANRSSAAPARTAEAAAPQAAASAPASDAAGMPQVVEGPKPTAENATGMFGGDKPFSLIVDQENGELEFKFNENKEVEAVVAKKGVILSSEEMTLNADKLDYDTISSKLVASGQRVVVRQGDVIATCQLFKYDPKTQESQLLGTPVVYNRDKNGGVSTTRGREILIYNGPNGTPQFKVKGGILNTGNSSGGSSSGSAPSSGGGLGFSGLGGLTSGGAKPAAPAAPAAAAPASNRINPSNPADVQRFARKTLSAQ